MRPDLDYISGYVPISLVNKRGAEDKIRRWLRTADKLQVVQDEAIISCLLGIDGFCLASVSLRLIVFPVPNSIQVM